MRALNERLQRAQAEQATRQEKLQNGRIRVEKVEKETPSEQSVPSEKE